MPKALREPRSDPRATATDREILAATIAALDRQGYPDMSFRSLARLAGTSVTTVARRFPTVADAAAVAWRAHHGPAAVRDGARLLRVAGLMGERVDPALFVALLEAFGAPDPTWRVITELLMVSAFEPALQEAVAHDFGAAVRLWCTPDVHTSVVEAAQRAYVLDLALGLATLGAIPGMAESASGVFARLPAILSRPSVPQPIDLPETLPMESDEFDLDGSDPNERRLFAAILEVVSERGLERASTAAIARAANASEGLLFGRYRTKVDAFMDAIIHHQRHAMTQQSQVALALAERYPPATVDAITMQRSLAPERRRRRLIAMEYFRAGRSHDVVAASIRRDKAGVIEQIRAATPGMPDDDRRALVHYGLAVGAGMSLLPLLLPDAYRLPFDTVLIPMHAGPPAEPT